MKLVLIILTIIFYSSVVKSETVLNERFCDDIKKEVKRKYSHIDNARTFVSILKKRKLKGDYWSSQDEESLKASQDYFNKFENSDWLYKTATIYNAFCKK